MYKLKHSQGKENIFCIEKDKISNILKTKNYRFISDFAKILFSTKVFLIEGLLDNTIINDIISTSNEVFNKYFTIVDCNGKQNIISYYLIMSNLDLIKYYDFCLFYDEDNEELININGEDEKYVSSIVNYPNLEESLFEVEKNSGDKSSKITKVKTKNGDIELFFFFFLKKKRNISKRISVKKYLWR